MASVVDLVLDHHGVEPVAGVVEHDPVCAFARPWAVAECGHVCGDRLADGVVARGQRQGLS
jgi:hypothetical protein